MKWGRYAAPEVAPSFIVEEQSRFSSFTSFLDSLIPIKEPSCSIVKMGRNGDASSLVDYLDNGGGVDDTGADELPIVCEAAKNGNAIDRLPYKG